MLFVALGHLMGECHEFSAGQRLEPAKPCAVGTLDIDPVQEQHVKAKVEQQGVLQGVASYGRLAYFFLSF